MNKIKEYLSTGTFLGYLLYLSILKDINFAHLGVFICLTAFLCYTIYQQFVEMKYKSEKIEDYLAEEKIELERVKLLQEKKTIENLMNSKAIEELNDLKIEVERKRLMTEKSRYNKISNEEEKYNVSKIQF